jgi:hypothetical protein
MSSVRHNAYFNFLPLWTLARNRGIDTFPLQELALRRECLGAKKSSVARMRVVRFEIIMRQ